MYRFAFALAMAASLFSAIASSPASAADCTFVLGFKTLHDMIPNTVGACMVDERHGANGDGLQETLTPKGTQGLLVWRKSDNWTAFTDGYMTWVNGPFGLQRRLNTDRFSWEADDRTAANPAGPPAGTGPSTALPPSVTAPAAATATATAQPAQPSAATATATTAPTPTTGSTATGVPSNPYGYNFTSGNRITAPPSDFCTYFSCIQSFASGNGYVVECRDGMYSKSGGISGSCSQHGGNNRTLLGP